MLRTFAIAGIFLIGPAFMSAHAEGLDWRGKLPSAVSQMLVDRA